MKFELEITAYSTQSVVALKGDISAEAAARIRDAYDQVCKDRSETIVFDFADVRYINSEGVAIFFALARNMTEKSPKMVFAALTPNLQSIIKIVGLNDFVQMVSDVETWLKESDQAQP